MLGRQTAPANPPESTFGPAGQNGGQTEPVFLAPLFNGGKQAIASPLMRSAADHCPEWEFDETSSGRAKLSLRRRSMKSVPSATAKTALGQRGTNGRTNVENQHDASSDGGVDNFANPR